MIHIREFVRSGGGLTEDELVLMMRERMDAVPAATQRDWLHQVELSLDGYGGERQRAAAQQVRDAVKTLAGDLAANLAANLAA